MCQLCYNFTPAYKALFSSYKDSNKFLSFFHPQQSLTLCESMAPGDILGPLLFFNRISQKNETIIGETVG